MQTWDKQLGWKAILACAAGAVVTFQLAYTVPNYQPLFVVCFYCLFHLANVHSGRVAFYLGLATGLGLYAPQLNFFWTIFQTAAIPLWIIFSLWLGVFLALGRACLVKFGILGWACVAPFVWMGVEYFRSEIYYLKFSWLSAGYSFSTFGGLHFIAGYGVYGIGFLLMAVAAVLATLPLLPIRKWSVVAVLLLVLACYPVIAAQSRNAGKSFRATGVQLEFPSQADALSALDKCLAQFPDTDLLVLSEYTFTTDIPPSIKKWCVKHQRYLVAGAEDPAPGGQYYNTAFVVGPDGKVVFKQAKSVPIQFFKDGLPAKEQRLWNSPWGLLGFGICYDASYTEVTDGLVRAGAQCLIFPTMDVADWGQHQHDLHARIPPMRAAEYGVPFFRLCSSGVSECINPRGEVVASAPFPGQGMIMSARVQPVVRGHVPPDRLLAVASVGFTGALAGYLAVDRWRKRDSIASV